MTVELKASRYARYRRLLDIAERAEANNMWDNPVMTTPGTWAGDGTANATLTKQYRPATRLTDYSLLGGKPAMGLDGDANALTLQQVTLGATGGNLGSNVGKQSYATVVEFMTDAKIIDFPMFYGQVPRILVNDQYLSKSLPTNGGAGNPTYMHLDLTSSSAKPGNNRIRLEINNGAQFYGFNIGAAFSAWQPPQDDIVRGAFFVDSIGVGVGTAGSLYLNAFSQIAAKRLGWRSCQQIGIGGTGYQAPSTYWKFIDHISDLSLASIDILVVAGGVNDGSSGEQAAVLAFLQAARALLPNVPIVVLGSFGGSTGPSATVLAVEAAISAAVTQLADPDCFFQPVSTATSPWLNTANAAGYINGTPHPNDAGHDHYGYRTAIAVRTALQSALA